MHTREPRKATRIATTLILIFAAPLADAQKRRAPPPMFSPAYVEALQDVLALEPHDVAELENRLVKNPDDFAARLKLMAYSMRADRAALPESRTRRAELMLWLVEHRPDSEILGSPYASFQPGDLTQDQIQRAMRLWKSAIETHPSAAPVMWNAANFYALNNPALYVTCLEKAVDLSPATEYYSRQLGLVYAGAILSGADPNLARRATQVLETTTNALLLEPAVKLFQSEYNKSLMMGHENAAVGALAWRYFVRAKALDPDLDEAWIYQKIDPKMIGMLAPGARPPEDRSAQFEAAAKQIRRLPPGAFPELPSTIAAVLRARGCLIPQPAPGGPPRNVIRGEFFVKGQPGWAVLCSAGGFSSILAFRSDADAHPEELAKSEDKLYPRDLSAVDRKFIMEHYRASGGPQPPPIDHQGIDDAFLEKASITYYWYAGKWHKLTGAD